MDRVSRAADIERFRRAVGNCLGLHFDAAAQEFLAAVLCRRLDAVGQPLDRYLDRLEAGACADETGALALELTVSETYFFRYREQLRAFAELALPNRMASQSAVKRLRILSAGCASGEEAYSLAVLIRDVVDRSWDVTILGVDVNPTNVKKATDGRYSAWALRETPADVQQRWFKPDGREFVLDDALRIAVRFEVHNLAKDAPSFLQPETYDVVFFRNVLMYFTPEQARAVITRLERALKPGGYLFLGHAETLRGLSHRFHIQQTHGTFYYQRADPIESSAMPAPVHGSSYRATTSTVSNGDGAWVEAIARASERIEVLRDQYHGRRRRRPER